MSNVITGNGVLNSCLSEPQGFFSVVEGNSTNVFVFSLSLLLNHLEPQSCKAKLLPIMPIGIVAYAFTLSWDNLCRNSCMSDHSVVARDELCESEASWASVF